MFACLQGAIDRELSFRFSLRVSGLARLRAFGVESENVAVIEVFTLAAVVKFAHRAAITPFRSLARQQGCKRA